MRSSLFLRCEKISSYVFETWISINCSEDCYGGPSLEPDESSSHTLYYV